jgi:hypothetical protein
MNVYMVQNKDTEEWWGRWGWEEKHHKGKVWPSRKGPRGVKGANQRTKHLMDIVIFELQEIGRD